MLVFLHELTRYFELVSFRTPTRCAVIGLLSAHDTLIEEGCLPLIGALQASGLLLHPDALWWRGLQVDHDSLSSAGLLDLFGALKATGFLFRCDTLRPRGLQEGVGSLPYC